MQKENFRKNLKTLLVEWSLLSTFHCYPKIFQTKNIYAKLTWSLLFLIFSCLTFWFVVKGILDFLEYDVVTKIRVISQQSITFPTITICDSSLFTTKESEQLLEHAKLLDEKFYENDGKKHSDFDLILNQMENLVDFVYSQAPTLNDQAKMSLGFPFETLNQRCLFDLAGCSKFEWIFSYKWGNCYQFNVDQFKKTTFAGQKFGLELYLGPLKNANKFSTSISSGLRVFIHDGSFLAPSAKEILIEMGKQTNIEIRKTLTSKAPSPHSQCQDLNDFESNSFNYVKYINTTYRQRDCKDFCMQEFIIEKCDCFFTLLPVLLVNNNNNKAKMPCLNKTQFNCVDSYFLNVQSRTKATEKCELECPLECDTITYDWSMSTLDYPSTNLFNTIRNNSKFYSNYSFTEYKESHLVLNVYYPSVEQLEIIEIPKTSFAELLANLGGVLGIFLGFSIFSVVEFFELIFYVFNLYFKRLFAERTRMN
jgi:hypothetical protein